MPKTFRERIHPANRFTWVTQEFFVPPRLTALRHAALVCLFTCSARSEPVDELPLRIVTPTRSAADPFTLPATSALRTAEGIHSQSLARSTPEALRDLPAVHMQKTGNQQTSPYLRGMTGYHTLFLVDGIRLNNSQFRSGPNQYWGTVDSFSFERLEVLFGAAGATHGSDAVGGVVQTLSPDPFRLAGEDGLYGRLHARVSDAERSQTGRAEGAAANASLALRAGITVKAYGDVESGGGTQRETAYDEQGFDLGAAWLVRPGLRLDLVHQTYQIEDAPRTHSTIHARPYRGTRPGSDFRRDLDHARHLTYARLTAEDAPGALHDTRLTLSWHEQSEREFRVRRDGTPQRQGVDVGTFGVLAETGLAFTGWDLTLGADYYRDEVDSFSRRRSAATAPWREAIQGPVGDDATYDLASVFAQAEFILAPSLRGLLGARHTYAAADVGRFANPSTGEPDKLEESWHDTSLSGRLIADLSAGQALFGGVSQGFRAPNLSDLTRLDSARSGELEIPSTGLDPEHFLSIEAGWRARAADRSQVEAVLFRTELDGLIDRQPTGAVEDGERVVRKSNSGDGFVQGAQLAGVWRPDALWSLRGQVTWMEGESDTYATSEPVRTREPLTRMLPLSGQVALRWTPQVGTWLEAVALVSDAQDRLSPGDRRDSERIPPGGTPGYEVFTLRGGLELRQDLRLTVAVENVLDEDYRVHGSGLNEPGRNVLVALDARF
jgi:hemoglobin/transferrin/lactoferrin receptor protein